MYCWVLLQILSLKIPRRAERKMLARGAGMRRHPSRHRIALHDDHDAKRLQERRQQTKKISTKGDEWDGKLGLITGGEAGCAAGL